MPAHLKGCEGNLPVGTQMRRLRMPSPLDGRWHGSGGSGDGLRPGAGEVDRGRAPGRGPARWEKEVGPTQLNSVDFRFKTNFKLNKI
jgi:hypothetical protein